ncbi:MAG: FecR domain-containing protein [Rhodoferax sp.]|nr:FecR domain-containing protein [Rhodoferax sp.]
MSIPSIRKRATVLAASFVFLGVSGWANADPPSRVARLGFMGGPVSFSPAGEVEWVQAAFNRPLVSGDRLWTDANARAEIQVGAAMLRMNADTGVLLLNLDDRIAQLQLTEGSLNVRVRALAPGQLIEVDTPNLAFTLRQPGEYRITVDPDGNFTDVVLRRGIGEVYGEGTAYTMDASQPYRFSATGLRHYQVLAAPAPDAFDRWSSARDRAYDQSVSARYVARDVVGYQDLDANGGWRNEPGYGNVWVPNRVAAGWAPYRDGHWAWVGPWGWTWVDDAPWGFAVSHYGRWAHLRDNWAWVPGPIATPAWYAPALVAFVGGANFRLTITITSGNAGSSGIAWFPLAPREVYQPPYAASPAYVTHVNNSNTVVNSTVINNIVNTTNITRVVYANRDVPGALIAVPTSTFVQSQPVARALVHATPEMLASASVSATAPVAPTERSVHGPSAPGKRPPQRVFERPAAMWAAPAATPAGFAAQPAQWAAPPVRPLDDAARNQLKAAAAPPAAAATVAAAAPMVKPAPVVLPRALPTPPQAPATRAPTALAAPQRREQAWPHAPLERPPQRPTLAMIVPARAPALATPATASLALVRPPAPPPAPKPAKPEPAAGARGPEHRPPAAEPRPASPQPEPQARPVPRPEPQREHTRVEPGKHREGGKSNEQQKRGDWQHK